MIFTIFTNIYINFRIILTIIVIHSLMTIFSWSQVYEKVVSFTVATANTGDDIPIIAGVNPVSGLILASDGSFYGTCKGDNVFSFGSIYKITSSEEVTTLTQFGGGASGESPQAPLIQGGDGNFYGMTIIGGVADAGTIFKVTPAGALTSMVAFTGASGSFMGDQPMGALVQGSDGNFYGATNGGGASNKGTIFKMTPHGEFTTLVQFTGNGASNKGGNPAAMLIQASDGNFYGTTRTGGASDKGTIFRMTPTGTLTTLVEFTGTTGSNKGASPSSGLIQASNGNFYGTTGIGGAANLGTIYMMTSAGNFTTLAEFTGTSGSTKGSSPCFNGKLIQASDGMLYGMTAQGGSDNFGTIFKMEITGELTTLVEFTGSSGINMGVGPAGVLVQGIDGNLYGTTAGGGVNGFGTVYKMTTSGVLTTLAEFTGKITVGKSPTGTLAEDSDGFFYGTTTDNGQTNGTIFKLAPTGNATTLLQFTGTTGDNKGRSPQAGLIRGSDGNLYGTTANGGASNLGTVFKITPSGVLTTMVEFTGNSGSSKGSTVNSGLVQGDDGNFYGTTRRGGVNGVGTVFRMTSSGILTTLVEFTNNGATNKGTEPWAGLAKDTFGNFYGTTRQGGTNSNGTIFKMTSSGILTTLVNFGGIGSTIKGIDPYAPLCLGNDGNFYGTTLQGGAGNSGTVFSMTPDGVLTTLVEFTNNGSSNKGSFPYAGLIQGTDGNFYGGTNGGGSNNNGTLYQMTPTGVLTTLVDFASDSPDGYPKTMTMDSTGNLYGTRSGNGGNGCIFRLVFPGRPNIARFEPQVLGDSSAIGAAKVNARGAWTTVTIEYGLDGVSFPNILPVSSNLTGYTTTMVGTTLTGLNPNGTYYYRFKATNSFGTTVSPVSQFTTLPLLAMPTTTILPADTVLPTSAVLNGAVNARNYNTTVAFEWGTDGNSFPNTVAAIPASAIGNTDTAIYTPVAGLTKGTTYYYRISATNAGGTTVSGTQSFTTLTDPTATVATPTAITSQSAILNGSVNANGASTAVIFEYGTNGTTFPFSVGATPSTVTGDSNTPVSATLSGLTQGATYYYRVKATSAGGIGVSTSASLALDILSGFTQVYPTSPLEAQGFVLVTLSPSGVGSWRFTGESQWRPSGIPVSALTTGDRSIEFRPVPGYIQPPLEIVSIVSGGAPTLIERVYYDTPTSGSGGLSVTLKPAALAAATVPEAQRAQWRLLGENDTQWRDTDETLTGLLPGNYLIECKPVEGRTTPPTSPVLVQDFQTAATTLTYFLADALTGTPPSPLPFETVSTDTTKPYAYVGQIRSNAGSSSGFVVKQRVVATAGHVVFDDGTLAAVIGLQWLFQRHRGTYEPKPQIPRGYYIFDGYAAQRALENTPGSSSPQSQNLDVAALYFLEDAGRAGYGGFLASDALDNEFLLSSAQKMLVGYPVDGISTTNQGRMHATPASNVNFTRSFGRTFITPDIRSSGGMSGGPLCVQFESGNYYPAAIYLGGTGQTVVRSIDSQVIDLFNRAVVSGNGGDNNTGGGITHTSFTTIASASNPGSIRVTILPAAAASIARWGLKSDPPNRLSGSLASGYGTGDYILELTTVSGFQAPTSPTVRINGGQVTQITFTYVAEAPQPAITSAGSVSGTRGQSLNYQIIASQSPTSYSLTGTLPTGLNFNTSTGLLSGTLQEAGVFIVTLGATNSGGTGTKTLVITSRPAISNQSATVPIAQTMNHPITSSESGDDLHFAASDLPPGTTLNELTGLITGIPTQSGVYSSLCTVTKSGASASAILTITVSASALELWRLANFQTTANTGTAADGEDPDKDGQNNLAEYAAGTNPNNPLDVFKVLTTQKTGYAFTVTAAGKNGRTYSLQRRTDFTTGTWTTVISQGPLTADAPITLIDNSPIGDKAFYRIHLLFP